MKRVLMISLMIMMLAGCATSSQRLQQVSLGMDKERVTEEIGDPSAARGAIQNKFGQTIEVWEYVLALPSTDSAGEVIGKAFTTIISLGAGAVLFKGERQKYWLYFVNDKLVRYGQAGDWGTEANRIYEIRFR
jgi:hypothetical protein